MWHTRYIQCRLYLKTQQGGYHDGKKNYIIKFYVSCFAAQPPTGMEWSLSTGKISNKSLTHSTLFSN
jgi:hypothetical protein